MLMKFHYLGLLSCFSPIAQVNATTPKSVTCTRTEYREEYIPGTKSNPGYVKSYEAVSYTHLTLPTSVPV